MSFDFIAKSRKASVDIGRRGSKIGDNVGGNSDANLIDNLGGNSDANLEGNFKTE